MKISPLDRILLLLTGLLTAYQVAIGINGLGAVPIAAYTIAFGVLLVAGLLLIILGFDVLESPIENENLVFTPKIQLQIKRDKSGG
jgi:hypothetical protein